MGPPGVTDLAGQISIAGATGRKYVRMWRWRWHARRGEIRGHRRTYIGITMPGKGAAKPGQNRHAQPLFLLDRIDKLGTDFRGDPVQRIAGVLDPEQEFLSSALHYVEVDFDLSDVMFVTPRRTR